MLQPNPLTLVQVMDIPDWDLFSENGFIYLMSIVWEQASRPLIKIFYIESLSFCYMFFIHPLSIFIHPSGRGGVGGACYTYVNCFFSGH